MSNERPRGADELTSADLSRVIIAIIGALPPKHGARAFREARAEVRAIQSDARRLRADDAPAAVATAEAIIRDQSR